MKIQCIETISELAAIGDAWDRLSGREPRFVACFSELRHQLENSKGKFRVLAAIDNSEVIGIACFLYANTRKNFFVAEKRLFNLRVRQATLFNSSILGQLDEATIGKFLARILDDKSFDLLDLGFIIVDSPLYNAATRLRGRAIAGRASRAEQIEWLIKLPKTFDGYIKSLGYRTKRNDVRHFRLLSRDPAFDVQVIHRLDQIDKYLLDGEKISRRTYQWNLNAKFRNDAETRARLVRAAEKNRLRCYIAYYNGEPCAFIYGEWRNRFYIGRQVGFDPRFARKNPGTVLMLHKIRDLIENTDCEFFDFGVGGYFDYKKRFGNVSLRCARMQVGYRYRPYSFGLIALDRVINSAKALVISTIEHTNLTQRMQRQRAKWVHRYGDKPGAVASPLE